MAMSSYEADRMTTGELIDHLGWKGGVTVEDLVGPLMSALARIKALEAALGRPARRTAEPAREGADD